MDGDTISSYTVNEVMVQVTAMKMATTFVNAVMHFMVRVSCVWFNSQPVAHGTVLTQQQSSRAVPVAVLIVLVLLCTVALCLCVLCI